MPDRLVAWLYGTPVASISPAPNFRMTLEWRAEGIERWGRGSRVLSVGLPTGSRIGPRDMRGLDFFENILPEGPALRQMASLAEVRPADTYGILAAFGRDCAGAIMVLPDGEEPGGLGDASYSPLPSGGLRQLINSLDTAPLGADPERGFRPSLAGFQRKALLGRAPDGAWRLPGGDAPSTWILKPDGPHKMSANESACLQLARRCGIEVPETELIDLDGLLVLAVKRYDRQETATGPVRVHQEDGCQATATPPGMKYEEQGGPSLRDLATVLRDFGMPADVTNLLRRVVFNVAVGNADAHAKNFSILHDEGDPFVRLAPCYDVLSTVALELADASGNQLTADTHMGQRIGGQSDIGKVTSRDLIAEGASWGIRRATVRRVVSETLDQVIESTAKGDGPDRVLETICRQAERVRAADGEGAGYH